MSDDLGKRLREVLRDAAKNHIYGQLHTDEARKEYAAIEKRVEKRREELNRLYQKQYNARVDTARAELMEKLSQLTNIHPAPEGGQIVNKDEIERQAHRQVQLAHEADIQRVAQIAVQSIGALLERSGKIPGIGNVVKGMYDDISFQRNAEYSGPERRSGIERRAGIDRRRGPSRTNE